MKTNKKCKSVFFKYLISYIVLLLIPILVLSIVILNLFMDQSKKDLINDNINMLMQLQRIIDTDINELEKTVFQISINENLTPSLKYSDTYQKIEAIKVLDDYTLTNDSIYNTLYYFHDDDVIYSAFAVFSKKMFMESLYVFDKWDKQTLLHDLNNIERRKIYSTSSVFDLASHHKLIAFLYPVPLTSKSPYASVAFFINEKSILKKANDDILSHAGNIIILDENNRVITSLSNNISDYLLEAFVSSNNFNHSGYMNIFFEKENYILLYVKSEKTNLTYLSYVPENTSLKNISAVRRILIPGYLFIFLLGLLTIYIFLHLSYNPIKKLKIFTEKISGDNNTEKNEIQAIQTAISNINSANEKLGRKIKNSKNALKEYLLLSLIKGEITTVEEFNQKGKELGIKFTGSYYLSAVFDLSNETKKNKYEIIEYLEENLPGDIEGYGKKSPRKNHLIFLFGLKNPNKTNLKELFNSIQILLEEKKYISCTIGVGKVYKDISKIVNSYFEALISYDYKFIKGNIQIIYYSDINKVMPDISWYPKKELNQLSFHIKTGNMENTNKSFKLIIDKINNVDMPFIMSRCIYFDIINIITKVMQEINFNHKDFINEFYNEIFISDFKSVEELVEIVMKTCNKLSEHIAAHIESHNYNLKDDMLRYIDKNYLYYDFSINSMAKELNISPSYVSRYFKDHMKMTIIEYVANLRIEKSKKLLASTFETVSSIVQSIGYSDTSSFIKKFKQTTGFTPGQYRKFYSSK